MTPTQFKEKTRNFAAEKHLNPQIVQRYYMMEKLLECIVESPYHDDFVLKGISDWIKIRVRKPFNR